MPLPEAEQPTNHANPTALAAVAELVLVSGVAPEGGAGVLNLLLVGLLRGSCSWSGHDDSLSVAVSLPDEQGGDLVRAGSSPARIASPPSLVKLLCRARLNPVPAGAIRADKPGS